MTTERPPRRPFATYYDDAKNRVSLEDARASDPNIIMAQYRRNGTLPGVGLQEPIYGDFTTPQDLQRQMDLVANAYERFNLLPADVRTASDHNPARFLEMLESDDERAQLESAGLIIYSDTPNQDPEPSTSSETGQEPPTPE